MPTERNGMMIYDDGEFRHMSNEEYAAVPDIYIYVMSLYSYDRDPETDERWKRKYTYEVLESPDEDTKPTLVRVTKILLEKRDDSDKLCEVGEEIEDTDPYLGSCCPTMIAWFNNE